MLNKGKQSGKFAKPYLRTDNVLWGKFDLSEIKEMDILPEEEEKFLREEAQEFLRDEQHEMPDWCGKEDFS